MQLRVVVTSSTRHQGLQWRHGGACKMWATNSHPLQTEVSDSSGYDCTSQVDVSQERRCDLCTRSLLR